MKELLGVLAQLFYEVNMHSSMDGFTGAIGASDHSQRVDGSAMESCPDIAATHPETIVLQPCSQLTQEQSLAFQQTLEAALELAQESVIVDMLWVETVDAEGIAALVAGLEKAADLGKLLSFQSLRHPIRVAVDLEWQRQRYHRLGQWHDRTGANLAQFLGKTRKRAS